MQPARAVWFLMALALALPATVDAQRGQPTRSPQPPPSGGPSAPRPQVERLGPNLLRIGQIRVDTAAREVSVPGRSNSATILEFVANTLGGFKAYESALTANTDAVTFNAALLLIGLDKGRAKVPKFHFDPDPPSGDPLDIWVEWDVKGTKRRIRVEQLLLDKRTNTTMAEGPWVYTGSSFAPNGGPYLAELDGVLIGFVHSPAPIIENPRPGAVNAYGALIYNLGAGLPPETPVTIIVKAIGKPAK